MFQNLAQNAETSTDRDGNEMNLATPQVSKPTIRGMQGQTWSETIRTDEQYFEMAFPRTLAVAERAWHRAEWELDWSPGSVYNMTTSMVPMKQLSDDYNGFASVLGCREIAKLRKLGIAYRVPPPGASIDAAGVLSANSELPCTIIMYSTDQGATWSYYVNPINIGAGQVAHIKSMSSDWSLESRVVVVNEQCSDCEDSVGTPTGDDVGSESSTSSSDVNVPADQSSQYSENNVTSIIVSHNDTMDHNVLSDEEDDINNDQDVLQAWTEGIRENGSVPTPPLFVPFFALLACFFI